VTDAPGRPWRAFGAPLFGTGLTPGAARLMAAGTAACQDRSRVAPAPTPRSPAPRKRDGTGDARTSYAGTRACHLGKPRGGDVGSLDKDLLPAKPSIWGGAAGLMPLLRRN
jgi:hypothetical protein